MCVYVNHLFGKQDGLLVCVNMYYIIVCQYNEQFYVVDKIGACPCKTSCPKNPHGSQEALTGLKYCPNGMFWLVRGLKTDSKEVEVGR